MSLTSCMKKAGDALTTDDRSAILLRAQALRGEGLKADAAGRQAVQEQLATITKNLATAEQAQSLELSAPSREDLQAADDRAAAKDKADKTEQTRLKRQADKDRERKELGDKVRQDASADGFVLGQTPDEVVAAMAGNGDLFAEPAPVENAGALFDGDAVEQPPAAPSLRDRVDAMKDEAKKAEALKDLNDALGDLGSIFSSGIRKNLTPEQEQKLLPVLTRVMDAAFRAGYYSFRDAARFVLEKIRAALGSEVADEITIDHLQGAYIGMAGRYKDQGADSKRTVVEVESKDELEQDNAAAAGSGVESGGAPGGADGNQDVRAAVQDESGRPGRGAGQPDAAPGADGNRPGGASRLDDGDAAVDGERVDQPGRGRNGRPGAAPGPAGDRERERSAPAGDPRVQPDLIAGDETAAAGAHAAAVAERVRLQRAASSIPVKPGDIANIRATLPLLLPEQQDDVLLAEQRFAKPDGFGMLFTNGTGTGKTFTGLGIVKRMHQAGKTNILIAAPNDKILNDWIRSGEMLGLDLNKLEDTKDAGRGLVVTTYANLGANLVLADRNWDAVVADEAHYLSSNSAGDLTTAHGTLQAITLHPSGYVTRASMIHRELDKRMAEAFEAVKTARASDDQRQWARVPELEAKAAALAREMEAKRDEVKADVLARQATRPRAVFLSATPFAWVPNLNYAQGYLFDWNAGNEGNTGYSYNSGDNRERFYMQRFGYRMRYNKLTRPEGAVDIGLMERQFNTQLKQTGAMSGRQLEVAADYDRRFVAVESVLGRRIDEALSYGGPDGFDYTTATEEEKETRGADQDLKEKIRKSFGYLQRQFFLEAIKARAAVPYIQAQLDRGRKVVVFHDFKKGGVNENPFSRRAVLDGAAQDSPRRAAYDRWEARFPDLATLDVAGLLSPIEALGDAFGDRISLFNGDVKPRDGEANVARFNSDDAGPRVLLVQSAKAEGWSGHDTTGKYPRVLLNLGMPTRPFTAIQQEGRIYRTGQVSDAMFRYMSTNTSWERTAFAHKLAERAETAENLAMGEAARALKQSYIDAFEAADSYEPGHEDEGKGGKEADRAANNVISEYDAAKSFYYAQQKRNSRNKSKEGTDYFPTPEPIGLKMVRWLDFREGETGLEPSAGHGAIARWFPEHITTTAVELEDELQSRLALVFNGNHATIRGGMFEDFNLVNKADGIAMNPPFGIGGSKAIPHLAKAVRHLREGGRVAAILPRGGLADKKLEAFIESKEAEGLHQVADIQLPTGAFGRAGTGVATRIVVFDKGAAPDGRTYRLDLSEIESVNELFDRLENIDLPRRSKMAPTAEEVEAERMAAAPAAPVRASDLKKQDEAIRKQAGASLAEQLGLQLVEHTTAKGKLLKGVIRTDLTQAQVKTFDDFPFRKEGGFFIREKDLAKAHELFPFPPVAREPGAAYSGNYETDLFGNPVPPPARGGGNRARRSPAPDRDVDTAAGIPAAPAGQYATRAALVTTRQQQLGARTVRTIEDSANALSYLRRSAVERLDAILTDGNGKPLAVIGGFKGTLSQTNVYPATLIGEAFQVPGARKLWLVHNHPSGKAELSRADENMAATVGRVFDGTAIEVAGIVAVAGNRWAGGVASEQFAGFRSGDLSPVDGATIPAQERQLVESGKLGPAISSPTEGKQAISDIVRSNMGRPTILLMDAQNQPVAAIPWAAADAMPLKGNGKLDALYRAVALSNAGSAIIGTGGPLTTGDAGMTLEQAQNLGLALSQMDVQLLDIVDRKFGSAAEKGARMVAPVLLNAAGSPATPEQKLSKQRLESLVKEALADLAQAPTVLILDSPSALPGAGIPADLTPAGGVVGGKIYLFRDNITSEAEALRTIFHELFHFGLNRILPREQYTQAMLRLQAADPEVRKYATRWRESEEGVQRRAGGMPMQDWHALAVEEALADIAEDMGERGRMGTRLAGTVQRIAAWMADLAQQLGMRRVAEAIRGLSRTETEAFVLRAIDAAGQPGRDAAPADARLRAPRTAASQAVHDFMAASQAGTTKGFNSLHKTISTQLHKASANPEFAKVFNIAQDYERDIARAAARPAALAPDVLPAFDNVRAAFSRLVKGDKEDAKVRQVGEALFAGTLENGPEADTGTIWSDAQLRGRFNLDDGGVRMYRQARKAIDASLDETAAALAFQMVKAHAPGLKDAVRANPRRARQIIDGALAELAQVDEEIGAALQAAGAVFDRAAELKAGAYAPLMRFGRFAVDVVSAGGERLHFEKFDTEMQAKLAAVRLAREHPGATVSRSTMSEEAYKLFAGVDPDTVALFAEQLDGQLGDIINKEAMQEWYRNAVSERSAMKRMIAPRSGMAGYSPDLRRVLASFITSNARLSARQLNMGDMTAELADQRERKVAGDVLDEGLQLKAYLDNPDEPFRGLRSLMFTWYLGGSVASALVNLTQPVMMTLPYLSQFGSATKALAGAVKSAATGKVSDARLAAALQRAADDGKVDAQEVHHLYHEGMASAINALPAGNDLKARAQGFATLWGSFFGAAENFNRRITFIAAFRMAEADAALGDPYEFATRAIDETQGIYNKSNRPNWARGTGSFGAVGVAAFTFKQYSIAYVELLVRMVKSGPQGKRAAMAMLGMLVLASGLQGLPGAEDLEDLIDTAAQWMGYRGNTKAAMRESLVDAFGSSVADVMMYGASAALPLDFGSRLGLGNLLPSTGLLKPSEEKRRASQLAEVFGPMAGFSSQVFDATEALDAGRGAAVALGAMAPLAVKNAMMGMTMFDKGFYPDMAGRKVTDTSTGDAVLKTIGFQPTSVSEKRKPERMVAQDIARVKGVEADIVQLRARAMVDNDQASRDRARQLLNDWNDRNPDLRITIKDSQVLQRVREMRRTSAERILNTAPRETRRALAENLS